MTHPWRFFAAALVTLAAGACHSDAPPDPATTAAYDYRVKHPIVVEPRLAVLRLSAVQPGALSADDDGRLRSFAGEFVRRGSGVVVVSVGARSAADAPARAYAQRIGVHLLQAGLKPEELQLQLVLDEPAIGPGTALLRFNSSAADAPECYDWSSGPRNAPSANFGCAIQHNLGKMVANPRDLAEPRPAEPGPARRSDTAIEKMNQGVPTWSVPLPWDASSRSGGR
jgi:pilus assembly protein CpaD